MTKPIHSSARDPEALTTSPGGARSVPEWIGATPDTPAPPRVRLRVFEAYQGKCYVSGRKIMPGDKWQLDHKVALINGGKNEESNLAPILDAPHKAKTADDVAEKAKINRIRMKHIGAWPKSKRPIKSRGFDGARATSDAGKSPGLHSKRTPS